jgi:Zn-dependent oligopeptidase
MRRALLAVTFGGLLLTGTAACSGGDDTGSVAEAPAIVVPSSAAASTTPPPDYSANTKQVCAKVEKVFDAELEDFGTEIGKMIAYKEAKQTDNAEAAEKAAGKQLKGVGTQIRTLTAAAKDPQVKAAGATSAAKFTKSASDSKFYDRIKSTKDLNKILESKMTEWLTPIAGYCA